MEMMLETIIFIIIAEKDNLIYLVFMFKEIDISLK
jgi:hypothetical protein